jgi:hypothetical protein
MKTSHFLSIFTLCIFASCSSCEVKEKANKAGKEAGQVIGEFASGISNGVEESIEVSVILTDNLKSKGIQFGKTTVSSTNEGKDNLLSVYIIFNQDFTGSLTAKAFDGKGLEMGRVKLDLSGKKDEARFIDFPFDKRTNIDNDSKLTIE